MTKPKVVRNKDTLEATPHSRSGKRNRQKGHDLERYIVKIFRDELGYKFCKTSRNASKLLDDIGVDIAMGPPLSIQAKNGYAKRRPKFEEVYSDYKKKLKENIPEDDEIHNYPYVLIHKLDGRVPENFQVTMQFDDWIEVYKQGVEFSEYKIKLKEWVSSLPADFDLPEFIEKLFKE